MFLCRLDPKEKNSRLLFQKAFLRATIESPILGRRKYYWHLVTTTTGTTLEPHLTVYYPREETVDPSYFVFVIFKGS